MFFSSVSATGYQFSITQVGTFKFPQVEAYLSFVSPNGETIKGLNKDAFRVFEDGKEIHNFEISSLRDEDKKVSTVIAIDCSYSMKDSGALTSAKMGAIKFVKMMDPADNSTVISFSKKITMRIKDSNGNPVFTSNKQTLFDAINSIQPEPFTRLYDGLYTAISAANKSSSFRKAVILLTDADKEDEISTHTLDDCIREANALGIPVYTIGEGSNVNTAPLVRIAQETGGTYSFAANPNELLTLYQQISKNIHNEYLLSYKSKITKNSAIKKHSLKVQVVYQGNTYSAVKEFIPLIIPARNSNLGLILVLGSLGIFLILAIIFAAKRGGKKRCPQCGHWVDKNAEVCPFCGYSFISPKEDTAINENDSTIIEDIEDEKTRVVTKKHSAAWLTILDGPDKGKTFDVFNDRPTSIGRSEKNDIVLSDSSVSRAHAKISIKDGRYFIHDLASLNGVFVNDKKVDVSEIRDGDTIYIGDVALAFNTFKLRSKKNAVEEEANSNNED